MGAPGASAASAVAVRQDAVLLASELEKVAPLPRDDPLQVVGRRERVQQGIHCRVQGEQVDHHEGVNVNCKYKGRRRSRS